MEACYGVIATALLIQQQQQKNAAKYVLRHCCYYLSVQHYTVNILFLIWEKFVQAEVLGEEPVLCRGCGAGQEVTTERDDQGVSRSGF